MRTSLLLWCTNNSAMPPPRQSQSGHHKAIRIVAQLGPGQLWQGLAREQWNPHRSEPNANPNLGLAAGELARNQELIIAESTVGGLYNMLRRSQFSFRVGIYARVASR